MNGNVLKFNQSNYVLEKWLKSFILIKLKIKILLILIYIFFTLKCQIILNPNTVF